MQRYSIIKATNRVLLVAASALVFLFTAAPAVAQVSSLDAYAGQAAVLGSGNGHAGGGGGSGGGRGGSSSAGTTGGGLPAAHATGTVSPAGSAGGGPASAVAAGGSGAGKASPARPGHAASGVHAAPAPSGTSAAVAHEQTRASGGGNPFSGVDFVVLVAGGLGLLGTGVLIRRMAGSSASLSERSR